MFKQDDVPYRIVPVGGYAELEARRDEALQSEEVIANSRLVDKDHGWLIVVSDAHLDSTVPWIPTSLIDLFPTASRLSPPHHRFSPAMEFAESLRSGHRCR